MLRDPRGFGVLFVLSIVAIAASLSLSLGTLVQTASDGASRQADRSAAFYLAEGIVKRAIVERLSGDPDWSDVPVDTLYTNEPVDAGMCDLVVTASTGSSVDVTASARLRDTRQIVTLQIAREGGEIVWKRLSTPFVASGS